MLAEARLHEVLWSCLKVQVMEVYNTKDKEEHQREQNHGSDTVRCDGFLACVCVVLGLKPGKFFPTELHPQAWDVSFEKVHLNTDVSPEPRVWKWV